MQNLYLVVLYAVLDVDEAHDFQLLGQLDGPVPNHLQALCWNGLWRNAAGRVTCTALPVISTRPQHAHQLLTATMLFPLAVLDRTAWRQLIAPLGT